jgi:hypothetical protein
LLFSTSMRAAESTQKEGRPLCSAISCKETSHSQRLIEQTSDVIKKSAAKPMHWQADVHSMSAAANAAQPPRRYGTLRSGFWLC